MEYPCWMCPSVFRTRLNLKRHVMMYPHCRLRVVCPWCRQTAVSCNRIADLKKHVQTAHPRACNRIPEDFFTEGNAYYIAWYPDDFKKVCIAADPTSLLAKFTMNLIKEMNATLSKPLKSLEEWQKQWDSSNFHKHTFCGPTSHLVTPEQDSHLSNPDSPGLPQDECEPRSKSLKLERSDSPPTACPAIEPPVPLQHSPRQAGSPGSPSSPVRPKDDSTPRLTGRSDTPPRPGTASMILSAIEVLDRDLANSDTRVTDVTTTAAAAAITTTSSSSSTNSTTTTNTTVTVSTKKPSFLAAPSEELLGTRSWKKPQTAPGTALSGATDHMTSLAATVLTPPSTPTPHVTPAVSGAASTNKTQDTGKRYLNRFRN